MTGTTPRALADLRVGDEVVSYSGHPSPLYRIRTVHHLTPKQIVLEGNYAERYLKNGCQVGGHHRLSLDPKHFQAARDRTVKQTAQSEASRVAQLAADHERAEDRAALERIRAYLEARPFSSSNQIIAAIGGQQLLHDDLARVVAMVTKP